MESKITSMGQPHTMGGGGGGGGGGTDIKYTTEFMQCMVLEGGDKLG